MTSFRTTRIECDGETECEASIDGEGSAIDVRRQGYEEGWDWLYRDQKWKDLCPACIVSTRKPAGRYRR